MMKRHRTARFQGLSITRTRAAALLTAAILAPPLTGGTEALAQGACVEQKLEAASADQSSLVGSFTAVSGDTAVFSAFFNAPGSNSAWVYERDGSGTWALDHSIMNPDSTYDPSAWPLDIDANIIVAGLPDNGPSVGGAAYVFYRMYGGQPWGHVATVADGVHLDSEFGISVAVSGDYLVVGAPRDQGNTNRSGAAHLYEKNLGAADAWGKLLTISPAGFVDDDLLGQDVAIDGSNIVIGAPGADNQNGRVLCTDLSGTVLGTQTIPASGQRFGFSVDIAGTTVVAASLDAAYRIDWPCTTPPVELTPPAAVDSIAAPVAITNDRIAVRGTAVSGFGSPTLAVFVFQRNQGGPGNWGLEARTFACDATAGISYGSDVDIDDSSGVVRILAGSNLTQVTSPSQQGAVLVPDAGVCGDNIVDAFEECDDGNLVDGDNCDSNCTITACGNGLVTGAEQCDDGNTVSEDGCSDTCVVEYCGDGIVQGGLGEECEPPDPDCSSTCKLEYCGNGTIDPGEQCDDGDLDDGDGCDSNCTDTACGNGIVTSNPPYNEVCDDGNTFEYDGCASDCKSRTCISTLTGAMEAWWTGDDCTPEDRLGAHDGSYEGAPFCPLTAPKVGANSMVFQESIGTYFTVPHDPALEPGIGAFAVDMWIRPASASLTGAVPLLSKPYSWSLYLWGGQIRFSYSSTAALYLVHPEPLIPDQWNFVAVSMGAGSSATLRMSVNGNTTEANLIGRLSSSSPYDLYVGSSNSPLSRTFDGLMDELEIFSGELSEAEMRTLYEVGSLGKCRFAVYPPAEFIVGAPTLGEWGLAALAGGLLLSGVLLLKARGSF